MISDNLLILIKHLSIPFFIIVFSFIHPHLGQYSKSFFKYPLMIEHFLFLIILLSKKFSLKIRLSSLKFSKFVIELDKDIDNTSYFVIFLFYKHCIKKVYQCLLFI